jgi:hypothetical protein
VTIYHPRALLRRFIQEATIFHQSIHIEYLDMQLVPGWQQLEQQYTALAHLSLAMNHSYKQGM